MATETGTATIKETGRIEAAITIIREITREEIIRVNIKRTIGVRRKVVAIGGATSTRTLQRINKIRHPRNDLYF